MAPQFAVIAAAAAAALLVAPLAGYAQQKGAAPSGPTTFRCTAKDGKKYYGSTIPPQCVGQPIEQLNARGMVIRRIDPEGDEKDRAAKEADAKKKREEDAATKEQARRNRALLATYTSEKDIEEARARTLAENQKAVAEVETRIEAIKKRRAGYDQELEFYTDKKGKSKPPAKLAEEIKNAEIDLKAQEDLLAVKKKEVNTINAKYDEDKRRYIELTRKGK